MACLVRLVIPGLPHHVTQRGNRRETVFFGDDDYSAYLNLLKIHETANGLRALLGEVHRHYAARINARNCWTGHLWQGRFGSVVMNEDRLMHAVRYVSLNFPNFADLLNGGEDP